MNNQKKNQNNKKPFSLSKAKTLSAYKEAEVSKFTPLLALTKLKNQKIVF